jgi:hypothetical protein
MDEAGQGSGSEEWSCDCASGGRVWGAAGLGRGSSGGRDGMMHVLLDQSQGSEFESDISRIDKVQRPTRWTRQKKRKKTSRPDRSSPEYPQTTTLSSLSSEDGRPSDPALPRRRPDPVPSLAINASQSGLLQ